MAFFRSASFNPLTPRTAHQASTTPRSFGGFSSHLDSKPKQDGDCVWIRSNTQPGSSTVSSILPLPLRGQCLWIRDNRPASGSGLAMVAPPRLQAARTLGTHLPAELQPKGIAGLAMACAVHLEHCFKTGCDISDALPVSCMTHDFDVMLGVAAKMMQVLSSDVTRFKTSSEQLARENSLLRVRFEFQKELLEKAERGRREAEAALAVQKVEEAAVAEYLKAVELRLEEEAAQQCEEERDRCMKLVEELYETKSALNRSRREKHDLETQVLHLASRLDLMNATSASSEECSRARGVFSDHLEESLQATTWELQQARSELRAALVAQEQADCDMDRMEEALAQATGKILELEKLHAKSEREKEEQVGALCQELRALQAQIWDVTSERDTAMKQALDYKDQCYGLQGELERCKSKLEAEKETALQTEVQAREEMVQLMDEKFEMRSKIRELEGELLKLGWTASSTPQKEPEVQTGSRAEAASMPEDENLPELEVDDELLARILGLEQESSDQGAWTGAQKGLHSSHKEQGTEQDVCQEVDRHGETDQTESTVLREVGIHNMGFSECQTKANKQPALQHVAGKLAR